MPLQFQPPAFGRIADQADITFCEFMEGDPAEWKEEYNEVLEEYITCLGQAELSNDGERKDQVLAILNAIGRTYDKLQDIFLLVQARKEDFPDADDQDDIDIDDMFPDIDVNMQQPFNNSNNAQDGACLMSKLRKFALEALERDDAPMAKLKRALWLQSYERIKYVFETRVVKVLSPAIFLTLSKTQLGSNQMILQIHDRTLDNLKHMYKDLYYMTFKAEEGVMKHPFLGRWLADDTKRTYATCMFDPQRTLACNFNTYVDMRASTLPPIQDAQRAQDGVNLILKHIKEVFCNDDQGHAEYIVRWMANIVKYPWKKTEVLLLLCGVEGCGKSMIVDFFGDMILGQHLSFQTASPGVDVFGKFAIGTFRKLLCFCDEGGDELTKYQDMLKNLITAKTCRVEKKGKDIVIEQNFTNVIVASNNANPIKISSHDRRVVAFLCSDRYKNDVPYFNTLAAALGSDEVARAFYEFLMAYALDESYSFQAHRPITAYYQSLMISSLPVFWRFMSFKCSGVARGTEKTEQARLLYKDFISWKTERGYETSYTEARFGKEMNELDIVGDESGVNKTKSSAIMYKINFDKLKAYLIKKRKFDDNAF